MPKLARGFGVVGATAIVVSNMIGTGIFTSTGFLAADLGSPKLVISIWLVGGLIAMAGALCYLELAKNFPRSGGEYVYLSEAWGPAWGFINGWVSFFAGFSAPVAVAALAVSAYLGLSDEGRAFVAGPFTLRFGDARLLAVAVVGAFTLLNLLGAQQVAKLQTGLTALKLAVISSFVILGFTFGNGDVSHFTEIATRSSTLSLVEQCAVSIVFVFFGYSGWNAAVYIAEEVRDPDRTLPIALALGTSIVTILYVALNALFVYGASLDELNGVVAVGSTVAKSLFGDGAARGFGIAMAVSLLASINAMCLVGPRIYYAMARNGAFLPIAGRLDPRWKTPSIAVLMQGGCSVLLILLPSFVDLVLYIGITLYLFSALSVLALFKFRRRPGWKHFSWLDRCYPLVPLVYVVMSAWVLVFSIKGAPVASALALGTVAGGALAYHLYSSRGPNRVPGVVDPMELG